MKGSEFFGKSDVFTFALLPGDDLLQKGLDIIQVHFENAVDNGIVYRFIMMDQDIAKRGDLFKNRQVFLLQDAVFRQDLKNFSVGLWFAKPFISDDVLAQVDHGFDEYLQQAFNKSFGTIVLDKSFPIDVVGVVQFLKIASNAGTETVEYLFINHVSLSESDKNTAYRCCADGENPDRVAGF